jgi:folylpolyglutamate synthase/dihydropteroate synthase
VVTQHEQPIDVFTIAKKDAGKNDLILVIGSVFLVADILKTLN